MSREYTKKLYELIGDGELDALQVLDACLNWMCEADVEQMCLNSDLNLGGLFEEEEEDDDRRDEDQYFSDLESQSCFKLKKATKCLTCPSSLGIMSLYLIRRER